MKTTKTNTLKNSSGGGVLKGYYFSIFIVVLITTMFLALNLIPLLTKTGNSNAESADVTVEIDPVLSLRLSKDEINLNPSPIPEGIFVYDTLSAIVDTNNRTGYTLTMNSETEEAALVQEDEATKIPSLTTGVTVTSEDQNNFTMNHWGYALASTLTTTDTTFNKIPALSAPDTIKTSDAPVSDDTTPVTLATRVDTSLPSGTYKNTLVFSATANFIPEPVRFFPESLTAMQDMTGEICEAVTTPSKDATIIATSKSEYKDPETQVPSVTLTDIRDNETYTVRKLADGNCWMTQNLRLVKENLKSGVTLNSSNTDIRGTSTYTLPDTGTGGSREGNNEGEYVWPANPEYGNGAYYSFEVAVAAGAFYKYRPVGYDLNSSICPKGWMLPLPYDNEKSYYNLGLAYGGRPSYSNSSSVSDISADLSLPPFDLAIVGTYVGDTWRKEGYRAGQGYYINGYSAHIDGKYHWLDNEDSGDQAAHDGFSSGLPVRCVARAGSYTILLDKAGGNGNLSELTGYFDAGVNLGAIYTEFTKPGQYLTGWKDQDGKFYYADEASINVNPSNKCEVVLTAQWEKNPFMTAYENAGKTQQNGYYKMQDMNGDICDAVFTPDKIRTFVVPEITLIDSRDDNIYIVRKLADGNCWMAQNLRIIGNKTLTPADSDISSSWTLPATITSGFLGDAASNVSPVNASYGNGAYYSWCAATAGTCPAYSSQSEEAPSSICPKGWRIPPSTGDKSYSNLLNVSYASSAYTQSPFQFVRAGYYYNNALRDNGEFGYYWSSTRSTSSIYTYSLRFSLGYRGAADFMERSRGLSVRCVAR